MCHLVLALSQVAGTFFKNIYCTVNASFGLNLMVCVAFHGISLQCRDLFCWMPPFLAVPADKGKGLLTFWLLLISPCLFYLLTATDCQLNF